MVRALNDVGGTRFALRAHTGHGAGSDAALICRIVSKMPSQCLQ
jgi:hypothetical protein